jgi:hypothetical protein
LESALLYEHFRRTRTRSLNSAVTYFKRISEIADRIETELRQNGLWQDLSKERPADTLAGWIQAEFLSGARRDVEAKQLTPDFARGLGVRTSRYRYRSNTPVEQRLIDLCFEVFAADKERRKAEAAERANASPGG